MNTTNAQSPAVARKLPYGISNFEQLITNGYVYVDKTRYIELLEDEPNPYQLFIRPRKFGKSLFFTMLSCYYDMNYADKFETLFKGLYIGEHPTPEHNSFAILKFDFSGLSTSSAERFEASFYGRIRSSLLAFVETYRHLFDDSDNLIKRIKRPVQSTGALLTIFGAVEGIGAKLFVLIDEYDHFADDLIALGSPDNNGLVAEFYETLKIGTKSVVSRIFLTGINPMVMNDLTGTFSIADNLTLEERYNEMLGFTQAEVDALIDTIGIDHALITIDIERYYNGYLFSEYAQTRVYNSSMTLYSLGQIQRTKLPPEEIIDDNLRFNYSRLRHLIEDGHNHETLIDIIKNGVITAEIAQSFLMDQMYREQYFVSLLFYMGLLTIDCVNMGRTVLKIPNYSIRTIYWEYLERLTKNLNPDIMIDADEESAAIRSLAYDSDPASYISYMSKNIFQRLSNRDLGNCVSAGFDEKYIKLMLLNGLFRSRLYLPSSEKEVERGNYVSDGYIDIFLQRSPLLPEIPYEWVWELKYLKQEDATKEKVASTLAAARAQLEKYRASALFAGRSDVKFAALVFVGKEAYHLIPLE